MHWGVILKISLNAMANKGLRYLQKVGFKNYERKIKSPFIIYAVFESILVPENNGKQNPNGS